MKVKSNQISVLIPEADSNFLPFIVNCLNEAKNIKIYILSNKKDAGVRFSSKIKNYSYYPEEKDKLKWVLNINNELKKFQIDIVMPIDEFGIEALINYKDYLIFKDKLVFLPSHKSFIKANDKGLLASHLLKNNLPTPRSFLVKAGKSIQNVIELNFPVLAKPTLGFGGGKGIIKFNSIDELNIYFEKNKFECDYLVEEYIIGHDLGCNVLCKNGKLLAYTMQRGTLWSDEPFSPQVGLEFFYNQELLENIEKLMQSIQWNGVANIDIRYDNQTNKYLILEINPRFWETTEASEIAGVNFPYLYCLASLNINFETPGYNNSKFLNLIGLSKSVRENKLFLFKFKFILQNTSIKYYLKDPLPLLLIVYNKIKSLFN